MSSYWQAGQAPLTTNSSSTRRLLRGVDCDARKSLARLSSGRPDGAAVKVKDVARVELGAQDYGVFARLDRQPTVGMAVRLTPDGNALQTARNIKVKMAELEKFFPKGMAWDVPYDSSRFVDISINEVVITLFEAMLLVFLVMYLFLENLRATLIPAVVVPVALTGAMIGLYLFGYSINVLTLFAMVLAIGIVVDDAIVVVENVERIMSEEGLAPRDATRKAMDQIFSAVIGITSVLCAVFLPMAFFGGAVGAIYRQFSVTLLLTMLFSALMALTLTPAMCATILHHSPGREVMLPGVLRLVQSPLCQNPARLFGDRWPDVAPYRSLHGDLLDHYCRNHLGVHAPAGEFSAGGGSGLLRQSRSTSGWGVPGQNPGSDQADGNLLS
jgi:multidrug efflux pump subunit AcrB